MPRLAKMSCHVATCQLAKKKASLFNDIHFFCEKTDSSKFNDKREQAACKSLLIMLVRVSSISTRSGLAIRSGKNIVGSHVSILSLTHADLISKYIDF